MKGHFLLSLYSLLLYKISNSLPIFFILLPQTIQKFAVSFPVLERLLSGDIPADPDEPSGAQPKISDEEAEPEPLSSRTKLYDSDPSKGEDEWGKEYASLGDGSAAVGKHEEEKAVGVWILGLKRCLVDTVCGTELGCRTGPDVRAEVLELVNLLEAANPTPAPVEDGEVLDGN